jgi:hypothetical protein
MKTVITRLIIFAAALFLSTILVIIGLGFLVWSSFLYLTTVFNPYVAALMSGLIAILLAGVVFLIVSALTKGSSEKKTAETEDSGPNFVDTSKVINEYPLESGLLAMAAGFIAGSSPDSKKALTELFVTLSQNSSK